jgi:ABC-2 type transport system permease protein
MVARIPVLVSKYWTIMMTAARARAVYVSDIVAEVPVIFFRIWALSQLFAATYSSTGKDEFDGMSYVQLVWCMSLIQCFESSATEPHVPRIIEDEVKSGALAYSLNKPFSYAFFQFYSFLGRGISNMMINLVVSLSLPYFLVGPLDVTWTGLFVGISMMFLGFILYFLITLVIGLLAFWIEDVNSIDWLFRAASMIFGGAILPLALFPDSIKTVAEYLPFGQLYYSAARLIVNFDYDVFIKFFEIQLLWLTVFYLLGVWILREGVKRVSISGG